MNDRQKQHLQRIVARFDSYYPEKFKAGAIEHKGEGELEDLPIAVLVRAAIEEAADLWAYLVTLEEKLEKEAK